MATMMQTMHDPAHRARLEARMGALKQDPDLAGIMQELESGGPAAMMQCVLPATGLVTIDALLGTLRACALAAATLP